MKPHSHRPSTLVAAAAAALTFFTGAPANADLIAYWPLDDDIDGAEVTGADEVTLKPGIYIIKGGPLTVDATMANKPIKGDGVLIYLADEKAELNVQAGYLSLRAMRTGTWAGIALMAARGEDAPPKIHVSNTTFFGSGIIYVPETQAEIISTHFNGVCNYLCFVSDTLKLTDTKVNYGYFILRWTNPFGDTSVMPEEPPALKRNFRPYLINKAPLGFF